MPAAHVPAPRDIPSGSAMEPGTKTSCSVNLDGRQVSPARVLNGGLAWQASSPCRCTVPAVLAKPQASGNRLTGTLKAANTSHVAMRLRRRNAT